MKSLKSLRALAILLQCTPYVIATPAFHHLDGRSIADSAGHIWLSKDATPSKVNELVRRAQGERCGDRCMKYCKPPKVRVKPTCKCMALEDPKDCPEGQEVKDNKCVPKQDCPADQERKDNTCVPKQDCPADQERKDNTCVPKQSDDHSCPLDREWKHNQCQAKPVDQDKEQRFQDIKKAKQQEYDEKKKRGEEEKKKEDEERKKIEDDAKKKRVNRMAKCAPLVALSFAANIAEDFSNEFFEADVLQSDEMNEFWPQDEVIPLDDEIDKRIDSDEFLKQWANMVGADDSPAFMGISNEPFLFPRRRFIKLDEGIEGEKEGREEEAEEQRRRSPPSAEVSSPTDPHDEHEKRFLPLLLTLGSFAARAGRALGAAGRLGTTALQGMRLARPGAARISKGDQLKAIRDQITKSPTWKDCLKGVVPGK